MIVKGNFSCLTVLPIVIIIVDAQTIYVLIINSQIKYFSGH